MDWDPRRFRLYRTALPVVIWLAVFTWIPLGLGQVARKPKVDEGPRAIGLLQLGENGKGRLFPVAIMVEGKFYDAAAYKAMPVPMALDFDIVYEGFRTGISQGLFTIKQPGHLGSAWIAEGTWLPTGAKPPETHLKAEAPIIEEKDEAPKLHRGNKSAGTDTTAASPDKSSGSASPKPADKPSEQKPAANPSPSTATQSEASEAKPAAAEDRAPEDPNRPRLRRGRHDPAAHSEEMKDFDDFDTKSAKPGAKETHTPTAGIDLTKLLPAISDTGGPDPRSYKYDLKPDEEADFRKKMLELASAQLRTPASTGAQNAKPVQRANRKPVATIAFDDVQMHTFDLSNTNQPVLVLSARTHAPLSSDPKGLPQEVTLVARTNLEGELHKLFFSATDAHDLDLTPRMELIDAVDADGDGRGELLFRRTFDNGTAYGIYRATSDQLWPLFEGTP